MDIFQICFLCFLVSAAGATSTTCSPENGYRFEYTQCDSDSKRWRVSVPKTDDCTPDGPRPPYRAQDCGKTCDRGHYLNMVSQGCQECEPGTFSLGDTAKYEDWSKLPDGFTATTQDISMSFISTDTNCTEHSWTPKGSYISVSPGACSAYLRYSGTIAKAGKVTFKYQLSDTYVIFHVSVQNDQCQKEEDSESSVWPEATIDGKWKDAEVALKSGFNVITWKVIGLSFDDHESMPVLIKSVTIEGAAYASECSKCPAGTYSSKGAADCSYCPENTFSAKGAQMCSPCDKETQWSRVGAVKCEPRPLCNKTDYYRLHTPCDDKKETRIIYQWIKPQICQPNNPDSVHLPANEKPKPCLPCNPGMEMVNNTCQFCPKDSFSSGEKCQKCDASTFPDTGYMFENWNRVPSELHESCISFREDSDVCHNDTKWLAMSDHIESHFARGESGYLVLQLRLDGFRTGSSKVNGEDVTVGKVKILFEIMCDSWCQLVLLSNEKGYQDVSMIWQGTTSKHSYEYEIKKNRSIDLTIGFQNSAFMLENDEYINSTAYIYSIEVTNTIGGGAKECQKCPKGTNKQGCVPCPDGHFIDPVNTTCVMCPPGTVVYTNNAYGAESCKSCGRGLKPQDGKACITDGLYEDGQGREYDFRNLTAGYQFIKGSPLFTSTGTQYYHGFNMSLFGNPVVCTNNVTKSNESVVDKDAFQAVRSQNRVEAMICRSTMVPTSGDSSVVMATQSSSLGDRLVEIVSNETDKDNGTGTFIWKLYNSSGFDITGIENDIQFHYNSSTPTRACPNGRQTIISLRCDLDEKENGVIDLPPKCADGTCDGCTFHFLWRSRIACPTCKKEDFEKVNGECIKGHQTVHYFPPAHCIVRDKAVKLEVVQSCTLKLTALPFLLQIAVPAIVALAAILCCLLCYSWRKNKKLEYKYMKLVEGAEGKEGELPGVDSCALEEGEDEGGDVLIRDSKGARFFKKLKNKMKKDRPIYTVSKGYFMSSEGSYTDHTPFLDTMYDILEGGNAK